VLNNLELRLDVIQKELNIPPNFRLSRGFVKELRIHIPWAALTTKSIEITLTDVECVLTYDRNPNPVPVEEPPSPIVVTSGCSSVLNWLKFVSQAKARLTRSWRAGFGHRSSQLR